MAAIAHDGPGIDRDHICAIDLPTLVIGSERDLAHPMAMARELANHTGLSARVENDGIAAALGEWRHGAGKGVANIVYLTVSTGIGGGVIADGRLLHGHRGMAGHIGHMRLAQDGPRCPCGAIGCFEALAAGTAPDDSSPFLAAAARSDRVEARHVFDGARAGDKKCQDLLAEEAAYLDQGITSAIHMFRPERVVIGGGLSNGFDLLEDGIHRVIQRDAMLPFRHVPVVRAGLGGDSGLWGRPRWCCIRSTASRARTRRPADLKSSRLCVF